MPIFDISHKRLKPRKGKHVRGKAIAVTVPWEGGGTFIKGPSPCGCEYISSANRNTRSNSTVMMIHMVVVMFRERIV